ncbi:MAG: methyltransferase domain-containing protein [Gammaproteobacteria bacterium]|nr:methyltransferase domain-containing protein [Gammaproteobacteria bacterium]
MADLFDEKSKDWDTNDMIRALSSGVGSAILKNVPLDPKMCVMDFGAGTGLISTQIAPHVKKIVAVDISVAMLEKLAAKEELRGKVDIVRQDLLDSPTIGKFDLIVSAMAMHHVEDTERLIATFAEHLDPGAGIALADLDAEDGTFHPPETEGVFHLGFERDALRGILARHGFTDITFRTAHTVDKESGRYPVFLVTATKQ